MGRQKETKSISSDDKAFFHSFYEENRKYLYYIANNYAASVTDCDDIVQDTLVRLLKNISKLRSLNRCATAKYIVLTVRSAFLDSEKRKHGSNAIFLDDETLETLIKADILIADSIPDISARLEVQQLKAELPPRDWLVLEGKYVQGYSQEELADMIGVSPDSIRMILCRAREKARRILRKDLKGGDGNG